MKRRSLLALIGTTATGTTGLALAADTDETKPLLVSLVHLLARPDELDRRVVMTAGYLAVDKDGADLYLHREDYEACILPNSLRVSLAAAERERWRGLHRGHVAIKARFARPRTNAIQSGTLEAVETIDRIPGREPEK